MTPLRKASRLWETVRHLRFEQLAQRVFKRVVPAPKVSCRTMQLRPPAGRWARPPGRVAAWIDDDSASFLNQTHRFDRGSWKATGASKLWLYNLHYFNDLLVDPGSGLEEFHARLMARWVRENPPGNGTGWEPYPTSQRIVNWCKWSLAGQYLEPSVLDSLGLQARWLEHRLERHLLGNHLFLNAKALVFAGCLMSGPEADRWRRVGLRILEHEVREQILEDGGQFERSPMYHALAVEDMLDLLNLTTAFPELFDAAWSIGLAETGCRMLRWLQIMCHPDGNIAFFNDAAFGIAPTLAALREYAVELGLDAPAPLGDGLHVLEPSGFFRLQKGPVVVIADAGPIGPDFLPGHAHADTLSFELSIDGRRILVNGGTSEYGVGPERQRQRGTASHNTVVVGGLNSSDVWSGFRVGRRARVIEKSWSIEQESLRLIGTHDGYRFLPGRPAHRREWRVSAHEIEVSDQVVPAFTAESCWHWAPGLQVSLDEHGVLVRGEGIIVRVVSTAPMIAHASTWHPEFGASRDSICTRSAMPPGGASVLITWQVTDAIDPGTHYSL